MSANFSDVQNTANQSPIYQKYHGAGFSLQLVLTFTPMFLFSLVGFLSNCSLIYVTVKQRATLNHCFNLLIAFECLGACLFELSFLLRFLIIPLPGTNYIRVDPLCFLLQMPLPMGMAIQYVTMAVIGVERLLCVLCPIWFKTAGKFLQFLFCMTVIISALYGTLLNYMGYLDIFGELKGRDVMCNLGDAQGSHFSWISKNNQYILIATMAFYVAIWATLIRGAIQKREILNRHNRHIVKAVSVIVLIIIFGWLIQGLGPVYMPDIVRLSPEALFIYTALMVASMVVAGATNGPVLFFFSSEYRKCYVKTFKFLERSDDPNRVTQVQQVQTTNVAAALPTYC